MSHLLFTGRASIWIYEGCLHIDIHDFTRADFDTLATDPALPVRHFDAEPGSPEFWIKRVDLSATPVIALHVYTREAPPPLPQPESGKLIAAYYQYWKHDDDSGIKVWIHREGREPKQRMYDLPLHAFVWVRKMCLRHDLKPIPVPYS